jgi:hypothetical protein
MSRGVLTSESGRSAQLHFHSRITFFALFAKPMTAVLAGLRELARPLSAFTAFQLDLFIGANCFSKYLLGVTSRAFPPSENVLSGRIQINLNLQS